MKSCDSLPDGCQQRFDRIDEKLDEIHTHTLRTNGRVTKLERITLVLVTSLVVMLATNPDGLLAILRMLSTLLVGFIPVVYNSMSGFL